MYNLRLTHARRSREKGIIAAEFAVSFPVVLSVFMVMMFLMDLMMVKQEVTNMGHSAMRHCAQIPNASPAALGDCVMEIIEQTQGVGANPRYSCDVRPSSPPDAAIQVLDLQCTYEGFAPLRAIFAFTGLDLSDMLQLTIPVFFPKLI